MRYILLVAVISFLGVAACSRKPPAPVDADTAGRSTQAAEGVRQEARTFMEKGRELYRNDEDLQAQLRFGDMRVEAWFDQRSVASGCIDPYTLEVKPDR